MHLREIECDEEESLLMPPFLESHLDVGSRSEELLGKTLRLGLLLSSLFFQSRKLCFPLRPSSQSFGRWLLVLVFHLFSPCCHWKQTLTKGGRTAGTLLKRNHSWKKNIWVESLVKRFSSQTAASLFIKESLIINTKTGIRSYHCKNTQ